MNNLDIVKDELLINIIERVSACSNREFDACACCDCPLGSGMTTRPDLCNVILFRGFKDGVLK